MVDEILYSPLIIFKFSIGTLFELDTCLLVPPASTSTITVPFNENELVFARLIKYPPVCPPGFVETPSPSFSVHPIPDPEVNPEVEAGNTLKAQFVEVVDSGGSMTLKTPPVNCRVLALWQYISATWLGVLVAKTPLLPSTVIVPPLCLKMPAVFAESANLPLTVRLPPD